jgi:hypothetical protein
MTGASTSSGIPGVQIAQEVLEAVAVVVADAQA